MFSRKKVHDALHSLCCKGHECSYCALNRGLDCLLVKCADCKASYSEAIRVALRNKDKLNDDPEAFKFIVSKYGARLE